MDGIFEQKKSPFVRFFGQTKGETPRTLSDDESAESTPFGTRQVSRGSCAFKKHWLWNFTGNAGVFHFGNPTAVDIITRREIRAPNGAIIADKTIVCYRNEIRIGKLIFKTARYNCDSVVCNRFWCWNRLFFPSLSLSLRDNAVSTAPDQPRIVTDFWIGGRRVICDCGTHLPIVLRAR